MDEIEGEEGREHLGKGEHEGTLNVICRLGSAGVENRHPGAGGRATSCAYSWQITRTTGELSLQALSSYAVSLPSPASVEDGPARVEVDIQYFLKKLAPMSFYHVP